MKKVMVFGTFDLLHQGHKDMFRQAKACGDYLIVVVARDVNVQRFKGITPKQNELERLDHVNDCELVDKGSLGHENDIYSIIEEERPAVICLGYDQNARNLEWELKQRGLKVEIQYLLPFEPESEKSSIKRKELG
jgi:FAD synthetase